MSTFDDVPQTDVLWDLSPEQNREMMRELHSGRFHDMLDAAHLMFSQADSKQREILAEMFPGLLEWAALYGYAEHLNQFEELRG